MILLRKADPEAYDTDYLVGVYAARFERRFLELVAILSSQKVLQDLEGLIAAGRYGEAMTAAEEAAIALAPKYGEAFVVAGDKAAEFLSDKLKVVVSFDQVNEDAVKAMREANLRMIREVSQQTRDAIREVLTRGTVDGINPREMAREIRESIGLTQRQAQAVANYRRLLEKGSAEALDRKLRDRRFDPTVQRAIDGDGSLTKPQVDRMVDRYRERALKLRAETIGRTEALRAVHEGTEAMFQQAIDSGELQADQIVRGWVAGHPPRTRDWHATMNRQQRGWGEPFRSGHGNLLMKPGDPNAPGEETINCRCSVTYRLKDLTLAA